MEFKICIFFFVCVYGYPTDIPKTNVASKNYKKYVPTIAEIKLLEREIWKATSNGDLKRALSLESRLESDVLKATLDALINSKKYPTKSKSDLKELGVVVRRDKRTIQMLSSLVASSSKSNTPQKQHHHHIHKEHLDPTEFLIRKTRQGKTDPSDFILINPRNNDTEEDINNELIPPSIIQTLQNDIFNITPTIITMFSNTTNATSIEPSTSSSRQNQVTTGPVARQEEEEEEEGGGGIGGLITSFLGSLSTPEGGVDLDAVTGLLGGLSTQNDDGSFDFTGLQDSVGSLFGGNEEGGSNVGAFLGGLAGAILRGSAGDGGAKNSGTLLGNLLAGLLPGISAYPTPEDEDEKPKEGLNSAGFFSGILSTLIGALGANSSDSSSSGHGHQEEHMHNDTDHNDSNSSGAILQFKFKIFKSLFSLLTKVLTSSSHSKSGGHHK